MTAHEMGLISSVVTILLLIPAMWYTHDNYTGLYREYRDLRRGARGLYAAHYQSRFPQYPLWSMGAWWP